MACPRDGSKASNIVRAAKRYGLQAKGFSKDLEGLRGLQMPCVVFWKFNHFLVVEGFGKGRVHLNDPARGHRKMGLEEFEDGYTGVVLAFEPGPEFERGGRRPSAGRAILRRLEGSWRTLGFAIAAGMLLAAPGWPSRHSHRSSWTTS